MRFTLSHTPFAAFCAACLISAGCEEPSAPPATAPPSVSATASPSTEPATAPSAEPAPTVTPAADPQPTASAPPAAAPPAGPVPEGFTPVAVENGTVKLTPDNTTIQIIGRHAPPRGGPNDPMARTIVFMKFEGQLEVDPTTKLPKSAKAEIDATSLTTFTGRLTSHLKNPDFIDVEKYPTIKFDSTKIEPAGEPGHIKIIGNLTLKDVTKEITIPAKVTSDSNGITVLGETQLKRSDFHIESQGAAGTMEEMDLMFALGKKSAAPSGGPGPGQRGG
jgi:polyisoprenoid-binding protein YceI